MGRNFTGGEKEVRYLGDDGTPLDIILGQPTAEDRMRILEMLGPGGRKISRARYKDHVPNIYAPEKPFTLTLPKTPLFNAIRDYLDSTGSYERTFFYTQTALDYCFQHPKEISHKSNVGKFSITDRKRKVKYVNYAPYTPTEIASAYLRLCQESAGVKLTAKYSKRKDICKAPSTIYFSGYYKGELAYIDLKQAYWQILYPTTVDMEYDPESQEIISNGHIPYIAPDEFGLLKQSRLVFGRLYNYRISTFWDAEKEWPIHDTFQSPTYRPYNYWYIMDVMHAVFLDCMNNFKIRHWLTDAPMVDGKYAQSMLDFLDTKWGLKARLEAWGEGESKNTNVYKIESGHGLEGKSSLHFDYMHKSKRPHGFNNRDSNIEGLRTERLDLLNQVAPMSPYIPPILPIRGWKQYEIKNAIPTPEIHLEKTGNRRDLLTIPENIIDMQEEIRRLKGQ